MHIEYKGINEVEEERFVLLLLIGAIQSLKDGVIGYTDASNWIANIATLIFAEEIGFSKKTIRAIHLSTEVGDIARLAPHALLETCDKILQLCKSALDETYTDKSPFLREVHCYLDYVDLKKSRTVYGEYDDEEE